MKVITGTLADNERAFEFLKLKVEKKGRKEKEVILRLGIAGWPGRGHSAHLKRSSRRDC